MDAPRSKNFTLLLILFVAGVAFSFPLANRLLFHHAEPLGSLAYYYERHAQDIASSSNLLVRDAMILPSREGSFDAYATLLAVLSYSIPLQILTLFLPPLLGFFAVLLLYKILEKQGVDQQTRLITLLIVVLSPGSITVFSLSSPFALILFLNILGLFAFQREPWHALFPYLALAWFGFFPLLGGLVLLLTFALLINKTKDLHLLLALPLLLSLLLHISLLQMQISFPSPAAVLQSSIIELGGTMGFGIFTVILAMMGFLLFWRMAKIPFILGFLLLLLSWFDLRLLLLLNLAVSLLLGMTIVEIRKMEWKLQLLKEVTVYVIICGLLFSTVSYTNRFVASAPGNDLLASLDWLHDQDKGLVLSHPSNGFWIQSLAGQQTLLDDFSSADVKHLATTEFFAERRMKDLEPRLQADGIRYIVVTKEMKEGLVWKEEEEGLLFLLTYNPKFKKVYTADEVTIWRYVP
ncbi:hypothetical protein HZB02_03455 [Candidatus Woesearchaeota archaeon]|nr:hypothetical protein [Candidatus Woesearchaeota archaeon]